MNHQSYSATTVYQRLRCGIRQMRCVIAALSVFNLLLFMPSVAQDRISYTLGDSLSGFAACPMAVKGGESSFDGPFSFDATEPLGDGDERFKAVSFQGLYAQGVKEGDWMFSYRVLAPVGDVALSAYRFEQASKGTDYNISGNFSNGLAQGEWKAYHLTIEESEVVDTTLMIHGAFNKGVPAGAFNGQLDGLMISGQFTTDGLVHGTWTFTDERENYSEIRAFVDGVLVKHYFVGRRQEVDSVRYIGLDATPGEGEEWREIDATGLFFDVMRLTNVNEVGEAAKAGYSYDRTERSNQLMRRALYTLKGSESGGVWSCLPGSEPLRQARVKLRYYPYSEGDKEALSEGLAHYDKIRNHCKRFFDDPVVDIGRYSYEDVAYYYEVFSVFKNEALKLGGVLEELSNPAFEYLDRSLLFPKIAPEVVLPNEISYEFKDSLRVREFPSLQVVESADELIRLLDDYLEVIEKKLLEIQSDVDQILEQYKREVELAENEKELIALRDQVIARYTMQDDTEDYNAFHADLSTVVEEQVRSTFKSYGERDIETRASEIGDLIACYQSYLELFDALKKVPLRLERIEEAFTRTLWNPYTYTYMDERVKERVYRAYEQVVLPAVLDDLRTNLNCTTVQSKPQNFVELYNRMLEIREQDTKQVERQLRRTSDFNEVVELLELELNLN